MPHPRLPAQVTSAAGATPPMVLRSDAWVALPVLRCLGGILQAAPLARARALRVAAPDS